MEKAVKSIPKKLEPYLSVFRDVVLGVLIWLLLTTTVGEARVVPSTSMVPTIQVGDRIWTDKLFLHFHSIERGDILVFDAPIKATDPYVKRVIGLPGDTVEVRTNKVWINGIPLAEPYVNEAPTYRYGPITIPGGQYLMLGDNRNSSYDGHYWGLISRSAIKARAVYRFWPLSRMGSLK